MRTARRLLALLAVGTIATGCSSSEESADGTDATSTSTATTAATTTTPSTGPTTVPTTAPIDTTSTTTPTTSASSAPSTDVATTAPLTTTGATTTTPSASGVTTTVPSGQVSLREPVVAEQGFLQMQVADGWEVDAVDDQLGRVYEEEPGLDWSASTDSIIDLVSITQGDATMGVFREGRFALAPGVFDWDDAIAGLLGIQSNIDVTVEWGGGRGESTRGRLGDVYVRHESVAVGDQLIGVLAVTPTQPSERLDAEVSAMIASIVVDPTALLPLSHGLDVSGFAEPDDGSSVLELSVVVPPHWQYDEPTDSWVDVRAEAADPEGPIGFLGFYGQPDTRPLDEVATAELEEFGNDWLDLAPDIEQLGDIGGADALVVWEGPRDTAVAAIVIASDGAASLATYIWTPGDAALTTAIVDTALVIESARLPAG